MIAPKEILVVTCDVCQEPLMYDHDDGDTKLYPPIHTPEEAAEFLERNYYRYVDGVLHCDSCWRQAPHEHEWQPHMASREGSGNQCSRCRVIEPGSQTAEFLAWQRQYSQDLERATRFNVEWTGAKPDMDWSAALDAERNQILRGRK